MGNRSFIQVDSNGAESVLLYGHWSGEDNLTAVRNVLARTARIGDVSYLTAQLFYEFAVTLGEYDGNLSFGISTGKLDGNEWENAPSVFVDADTGVYSVEGEIFTEFAKVSDPI
jgi:hypothetical protein